MKNIQIGGRACPMRQFKGKVVLDSELDLKSDSVIQIGLDLHLIVHISLVLQHCIDVSRVLHDPRLDLAGAYCSTPCYENINHYH
jgi:hypothetical protein